ncbi:mitochondrial uncoupling protein 4 isoform X2 [Dendrobates tinctorius]|uniref:mitochondrial uncoupling protein 4 isoform X2 n=1 Tax=Dendrobates tinctorius TaxID=92724 RepID=UPI003CC94057
MAPAQQVRPVRLCRQCGRASDVPSGSHQNATTDTRRGGSETVRRRRRGGGGALQRHGAHGHWYRTGGRRAEALAGSDACGVSPLYSGVRMVVYERLRDSPLGKGTSDTFPLWKAVIGGMTAGAIGQFFASPTDLVKVQMQMEGKRRLEGKPPRVRGVYHAFLTILSKGGVRGLWAGWVPNVQRAALVNMGDLTTYDSVKHFLLRNTNLQDNSFCHSISSICSGLVAATLGTPADVIKTRIMNQPRDKRGRGILYKSSTDCFIQAVRGEGFLSLYKGFIPTWMRMAPWSLVFWLTYEQIRRIVGVSSF